MAKKYANVPEGQKDTFGEVFEKISALTENYFSRKEFSPENSTIKISGQRYILMRAPSLSTDFFKSVRDIFKKSGQDGADKFTRNFLFDLAHSMGRTDAKAFHKKLKLKTPEEKLSAGPLHFAFSGWAYVNLLENSNTTPGKNFVLHYTHTNSFEADSWLNSSLKAPFPICVMNAGYSSGWCEYSFKTPLIAIELSCKALGDDNCSFVMAAPDTIEEHIRAYAKSHQSSDKILSDYSIPEFFNIKARDAGYEKVEKEKDETLVFLNNILENIPAMVFIKEAGDLSFVSINKSGENLLGLKREDLTGKTDYDFFPKKQADFFTHRDREVLESGKLADIPEEEIKTAEGIKILHTRKVPILDSEGKPKYLLGVSEDITLQKKAEKEIKKTSEMFKLAFENSDDAIVWADPVTRKIINLNFAAEELFEWEKYDLIDKPNTVLHPPQESQYYQKDFDRASQAGQNQTIRREIITKKGKIKTANIFTSITRVGEKNIIQGIFRDISGQLKTETELAETQEKYKKLLEDLHDPVFVFIPGEKIKYANRNCRELFGYSEDEIKNLTFSKLVHPSEKKSLKELFSGETIKSGATTVHRFLTKSNNAVHLLECSITPQKERDGSTPYMAVCRNITREVRYLENLENSRNRLNILFNTSPYAIFTANYKGYITDANDQTLKLFNKQRDEIIGHNMLKAGIFSLRNISKITKLYFKKDRDINQNPPRLTISAEGRPELLVELVSHTVTVDGEKLKLFIARDITRQEKLQQEIQESEKKYRSIFNLSPEVVMKLNRKGIIEDINRQFYTWTGYLPETFIGQPVFGLPMLGRKSRKKIIKNFSKRMAGKNTPPYPVEIVTRDGKKAVGRVYAATVKNPLGKITGEIIMIPDITFEVQARRELEEYHEKLENIVEERTQDLTDEVGHRKKTEQNLRRANEELASFAYTISHDMKAPFRAIEAFIVFLKDSAKDKLNEQELDYLAEMQNAVHKTDEMMEDLLEHSRITSVRNPYETVNIGKVVDSVLDELKMDIKKSEAIIKRKTDFPEIYCDRTKIKEVFRNLISNALKFTLKTGRRPEIEIGMDSTKKEAVFFVYDNGIGIEKEYQDKIFEIFRKLHPGGDYEGTGIGLANVKKIIDEHRGSIRVDSKFGERSTFYFTIPLDLKEQEENNKETKR